MNVRVMSKPTVIVQVPDGAQDELMKLLGLRWFRLVPIVDDRLGKAFPPSGWMRTLRECSQWFMGSKSLLDMDLDEEKLFRTRVKTRLRRDYKVPADAQDIASLIKSFCVPDGIECINWSLVDGFYFTRICGHSIKFISLDDLITQGGLGGSRAQFDDLEYAHRFIKTIQKMFEAGLPAVIPRHD